MNSRENDFYIKVVPPHENNTYPSVRRLRPIQIIVIIIINLLDPFSVQIHIQEVIVIRGVFSFAFDREFESSFNELRTGVLYTGWRVIRIGSAPGILPLGATTAAVGVLGDVLGTGSFFMVGLRTKAIPVKRVGHGDKRIEDFWSSWRCAGTFHRQEIVDGRPGCRNVDV